MSINREISKVSLWSPVIVWATIIFLFSSYPSTRASQIHWQDFIVKKSAHVIEFGILTTLLYRGMRAYYTKEKALLISLLIAILYGASDEFHQSFTPGREPTVRDVIFDTIGASIASILLWKYLPKAPKRLKNLAKKLHLL